MRKGIVIYFFLCIIATSGATEYADTSPISWDELQNKELVTDSLRLPLLSDSCPTDLTLFDPQSAIQRQSIIFFNGFYWAEYTNNSGKLCIAQFSDSERRLKDAKVLPKKEAHKLLSAHENYGIDYENRQVLGAHLSLQKMALMELDLLAYGGMDNIVEFLQNNPAEIEVESHPLVVTGRTVSWKVYSPLESLLKSYTKATLLDLKHDVKSSPPNRISNGKYPFSTAEELILEVRSDIEHGVLTVVEVLKNF